MPLTLIGRGILTVPAVIVTPPSHSVAYTNFIARTAGLDTTHLNAYADLLDGLTTDGLFNFDGTSSYFDVLYIFATQDSATALLNLVSSSYTATVTGSLTFTADDGYSGFSPNTNFMDSNFNAATAGGHYSQDSACAGAWLFDATTTNAVVISVVGTGENIYPEFSGSVYMRINDTPESGGFAHSNTAGFYFGNRSSSTNREGYQNNSSIGTYGSVSSQAPISFNWIIGNSTISSKIAGIVFGGSLNSTLAGNLYSRLRTYMTAVGVP